MVKEKFSCMIGQTHKNYCPLQMQCLIGSFTASLDISASVVISSRKQQNVEEAAEKLRAKGIEVLTLVCHVSNNQQRKDLIQKTAQCGNIDVIVSNAAANPSVDPILQTKDSALAAEMALNTRVNCIAPGFYKYRCVGADSYTSITDNRI
nr:tropinone reductase-like 3 [Arachis hypogaea]